MVEDTFENKFDDGEQVLLHGQVVTIFRWSYTWSYALAKRLYTYSIVERPGTFYYEYELTKLQ